MDNPENLATQGTQNENRQRQNTTQYLFDTTMRKHKQLEVAEINTIFYLITQLVVCLFYEMAVDVFYKNFGGKIWHMCEYRKASQSKSSN